MAATLPVTGFNSVKSESMGFDPNDLRSWYSVSKTGPYGQAAGFSFSNSLSFNANDHACMKKTSFCSFM